MPSARKFLYATPAIANGNVSQVGIVNLPKDLSILNRRGYASTDSKGVPYVFRVAVNWYPSGVDGSGYTPGADLDTRTTVRFLTVQNNWVTKNAGVAWHQARLAGMKRIGVKMSHLGAYAKEIRYNWDAAGSSWLAPKDGAGNAYVGGTWDTTTVFNAIDEDGFALKLVGVGSDEDGTIATSVINSSFSYLQSRSSVLADSNLEVDNVPSKKSLLLSTKLGLDSDDDHSHGLRTEVAGAQDNPPYDMIDGADTNNDITEPTEAARIIMYPSVQSGVVTTVFEAPYGIFEILASNRDPDDNAGIVDDMAFSVEVLDIYPMQG